MTNEAPELPSEEYEAQMIQCAFQELLLQECQELEEAPLTPEEEELLQLAERSRGKHIARIDRTLKRRSRAARVREGLSAAMKIAAVIVLIVSFSFGTALAVSPELREIVIEYLTYVTDSYVEVGAEKNEAALQVPDGWLGDYFPTYVPTGYELVDCRAASNYSKIIYKNALGAEIILKVYTTPTKIRINAEDALCYTVKLAGSNAYLYILDTKSIITWINNNQYYTLSAVTADIVLDMVDSLALIPCSVSRIVELSL